MEAYLRSELGYTTVRGSGRGGSGCISKGEMFTTERGKIFVKQNSEAGAERMFRGEMESLATLVSTGTVRVPQPVKVLGSSHAVIHHHKWLLTKSDPGWQGVGSEEMPDWRLQPGRLTGAGCW